jgi:hypothetical protein
VTRARLPWLAALLLAAPAHAQAPSTGRYAQAVEQELQTMGIAAHCEDRGEQRRDCGYTYTAPVGGRSFAVHVVYSDQSDTLYFYVAAYLTLPAEDRHLQPVLRRLMELNWELLLGKFEWNPRTGEVRLSAVQSTDSNFDRRAFRSTIHSLEALATRYDVELRTLAGR